VDKTLDFNIVGGISSNLLVSNTVSAGTGVKYQVGETQGLNNITFSSSLGMGMEYNFSDKLSLNLEPTFRYYFNPFGSITGINIHPVSFGIFSGFSYRF
jgi:opacity protein-like surface antigen